MSDPLERLGGSTGDGSASAPDVHAIKALARRIQYRRRAALGSGAAALVLVAAVGVLVARGPGEGPDRLAQGRDADTTETFDTASEGSAETQAEGPGASAPQPTSAGEPSALRATGGTSADADTGGLEATVEVKDDPDPRSVELILRACNTSGAPLTRSFGTAQRYDFEVSRAGEVVWRWSEGRAFGQVVGEETWEPGACKTWTERWDGTSSQGVPQATGSYVATGVLASSPELRSGAAGFCLDVC